MALYYIYIYLYIQPEDGFLEPKHVAVNYLKLWLIKVVLDPIYFYTIPATRSTKYTTLFSITLFTYNADGFTGNLISNDGVLKAAELNN
jgi:hypothetical protein